VDLTNTCQGIKAENGGGLNYIRDSRVSENGLELGHSHFLFGERARLASLLTAPRFFESNDSGEGGKINSTAYA
jgi:hypothetical protein